MSTEADFTCPVCVGNSPIKVNSLTKINVSTIKNICKKSSKNAPLKCSECGFVSISDAGHARPNQKACARLGSKKNPGRDFNISLMAATILGRYNLVVGIHQAGVSQDIARIQAIPMISELAVIDNNPDSKTPHPHYSVGQQKFDVIILNETIQSFNHPSELLPLLGDVKTNGLVIASTDLNNDSDISSSLFVTSPTTNIMWSGKSLQIIAGKENFHVDFRVPAVAVSKKYHRKRYVFFYREEQVEQAIRHYFSKTAYAPSEVN